MERTRRKADGALRWRKTIVNIRHGRGHQVEVPCVKDFPVVPVRAKTANQNMMLVSSPIMTPIAAGRMDR